MMRQFLKRARSGLAVSASRQSGRAYGIVRRSDFACWLWLPVALHLVGCRTVEFYCQAVGGHTAILVRKKPIGRLMENPATPPELSRRLQLVQQLCQFAETNLHLPAGGNYRHYADLSRPYVVWDIYAAPEFSLESKTWWYPFVGRRSYRGYFTESKARRQARRLERQGYDVFVGGIDAYSTLGWFRDPILNTFIHRDETDLADLIFHELAHQKIFVRGDTDFNEAFATTLAREGIRRWLNFRGNRAELAAWEDRIRREDRFLALILAARDRLEILYSQSGAGPAGSHDAAASDPQGSAAQSLREQKAAVFGLLRREYAGLKEGWGGLSQLDGWFDLPVNNARLNAEATYFALMPAFQNLLSQQDHELALFYEEVRRLGRLCAEERLSALQIFSPGASPGLARESAWAGEDRP